MKYANKRRRIWVVSVFLVALVALSGCTQVPDNVEDPLAFNVDAMLPFATTAPDLLAPTPSPEPTIPWLEPTPSANPLDWQNEKLPDNPYDETAGDTPIVSAQTTPKPVTTYPELKKGSQGTEVKNLQQRLTDLGYYDSSVNGQFGDKTAEGVRKFQIAVGMNQTSVATDALQRRLYASDAPRYNASASTPQITPKPTAAPTKKPASQTEPQYYTIAYGSSGSAVWNLQQRLQDLGYYSGIIDGSYGSGTESAVKRFQRAINLSDTGVATEAVQQRLFASTAPKYTAPITPAPIVHDPESGYWELRQGDKGEAVKVLQARLKELGYYTGNVDGAYGGGTVAGIKRFQRQLGLSQTGVATESLQERLFASNAPKYTGSAGNTEDYVALSSGDTGERVKDLQRRLLELGYFDGDIGGNYLTKTIDAVKRFQRAIGLEATGAASVALQRRLFAADAPYASDASSGYQELKKGDSGSAVERLQSRLRELGYYTGNIDGKFGDGVASAIRAFERAYNRTETGVATADMQKTLFSADAKSNPQSGGNTASPSGYIDLEPGDTGERVKNMQRRLKELGYFDGDIGGNYLTKTTDAVKRFQKAIGVSQTGKASAALQARMFASDAPYANQSAPPTTDSGYKELSKGSSGSAVENLQRRLKDLGYYTGSIDGKYGDQAADAVRLFEKAYGKPQTGIATVDLQTELFSSSAKPYSGVSAQQNTDGTNKQLKLGDSGEAVYRLQLRLMELGFLTDGTMEDATFDQATYLAVVDAQRASGRGVADGVAYPAFLDYLYSDEAYEISVFEFEN